MQENYDRDERKRHLRRLDAILTALEELNLRGATVVPPKLRALLEEAGVPNAGTATLPELIDRVLSMQQPFLVKVQIERRRRRRRLQPEGEAAAEPTPETLPDIVPKAS